MKEKLSSLRKFIAFYVMLPVILNLLIESLNRKSLPAAVSYLVDKPFLFIFNVLIIMLTLTIAMFFKREIFVLSMISIIWLLFGIVNFVILHFRVTPFSAVDFTLIKSAISVSGHYLTPLNIAMMILAAVIIVVSLILLFQRTPQFQSNATKKAYIISGIIVAMLACVILWIRNSNESVQALAENYTNISEAYENYGFVYCFTNSIIDTGISKPEEYGEESVKEIVDGLDLQKSCPEPKPNIIIVQLESFFDISDVKGLRFSKDPLPNFHKLQKGYSNGQITVPTVGAGTVNTEFEVLTGMSQHDFGVSEYPYKTILKRKTAESICYDLKEFGYHCHAVHNNTATFYGRNKVYSNLGFDSFASIEYMNGITLNPNGWAKDDVMTDEIVKSLDATDGVDFTLGITVQGHGKYDGVDPSGLTQGIEVYGAPQGKEAAYLYYVDQLYEVDQMIGKLVAALAKRDEPTVLALYGDHLPSLELQDGDFRKGNLYQTQYVFWDNLGLKQKDQDLATYQLYPEIFAQTGISNGVVSSYHQQKNKDQDYLEGLHTLEYDMLYGEDYIHGEETAYEPVELQMGTEDIRIRDVARDEEGILVTGENLTPYCKVYFNGKELESEWVDDQHIHVFDEVERSDKDTDEQQQEPPEDPKKTPNAFWIEVQNGDGVLLSDSNVLKWKQTSLSE